MKKSTGVVICNYNKSQYVVKCIQSVLESNVDDYDVFVVDNASTDDSVEMIENIYSDKVTLIKNKENLGGSGGFNTGIRRVVDAGYKYLWCLDNDVLVDENALKYLIEFLDNHDDTGMVGSKVYNMENPDIVQQFGMKIDFDNYCVEAKYLNYIEDGSMPEIVYSDAVAACSLLVRTDLIRIIGTMPEDNFLYWDDTEWGYRCNLAGYKVASYGKSQVLHSMGAKKESSNTFPTYYAWRNWITFFMKYTPAENLEQMAKSLVHYLFDVLYEGMYNGFNNRAKTVMYAYDDALHGISGRAEDDKIFDLDNNDDKFIELVSGKNNIYIEARHNNEEAHYIEEKIYKYNPDAVVRYNISECNPDLKIRLCNFIFSLKDIDLKYVYIDSQENILATEEDALKVLNYNYSYELFLYSQLPLFMKRASYLNEKVISNEFG